MKNIFTFLLIVFACNLSNAQTTAIPDANFESSLINQGYDFSLDGEVLTSNIDTIRHLEVFMESILDLTGIEDFTSLTFLNASLNQLTTINLSTLTGLETLSISSNMLATIDVSQLVNLKTLICEGNQLSSIDVSQNLNLKTLSIGFNNLSSLNLASNIGLEELTCNSNQIFNLNLSQNPLLVKLTYDTNPLVCLNVKNNNNTNFTTFYGLNCPSLSCIEVDDSSYSTNNWNVGGLFNIDPSSSFSNNCNNNCTIIGIDDYSQANFSIYPNPTSNQLIISFEERINGFYNISIRNSLGQIVREFNPNGRKVNVDLSDLDKGVYFINVSNSKGNKIVQIIKQ